MSSFALPPPRVPTQLELDLMAWVRLVFEPLLPPVTPPTAAYDVTQQVILADGDGQPGRQPYVTIQVLVTPPEGGTSRALAFDGAANGGAGQLDATLHQRHQATVRVQTYGQNHQAILWALVRSRAREDVRTLNRASSSGLAIRGVLAGPTHLGINSGNVPTQRSFADFAVGFTSTDAEILAWIDTVTSTPGPADGNDLDGTFTVVLPE